MIIVFGGEKGGTGKTTHSVNFAVKRVKEGRDVLLIDTNYPQNSASQWVLLRDENKIIPRIPCIQKFGKNLSEDILSLAPKYDDIIVDAGGYDSTEFLSAIAVADALYSPLLASQFSLWTVQLIDKRVSSAKIFNSKLKAFLFINSAPTNPSLTEAKEAISHIKECELESCSILETIIYDRVVFRKVIPLGLSIIEYKPKDEKAVLEFESLYEEILKNGE